MSTTPFPATRRRFTQEMVDAYGEVNEDRNLLHYDRAAAERAGFPAPLVHGALLAALLSEACRAHFGASWLTAGRLKVAFVKPVFVGQTVATGGTTRADGGWDVWCRNEAGENVVVGEARCG